MSQTEHDTDAEPSTEQRDEYGPVPAQDLGPDDLLDFGKVDGFSLGGNGHIADDTETKTEQRKFVPASAVLERRECGVVVETIDTYEAEVATSLCGQVEVVVQDDQKAVDSAVCKSCLRILKARVEADGDE